MKRVVLDIETDGLSPTKIWVVVVLDVDTQDTIVAHDAKRLLEILTNDTLVIGHNVVGFDAPVLARLWNIEIPTERIVDTLVCSRLFNFTAAGGHSLARWGERLGLPKVDHDEWWALDDPVLERARLDRVAERCIQDCHITRGVFLKLEKAIYSERWKESLKLEHDIAKVCQELHENGFTFAKEKALLLQRDLQERVELLSVELRRVFPARPRFIREVTPRITQHGTIARNSIPRSLGDDLSIYSAEAPFSLIEWEEFNPGSPLQVVERLNEAGWEPFEKTEGHKKAEKQHSPDLEHFRKVGWKISEENLETLPEDAPEDFQLLVKWRMLSKRLQTLDEWLRSYNEVTGRIHGDFSPIGTWTHRMSHSNPNQGNVPSVESKYHAPELVEIAKYYGSGMRSLFMASVGQCIVGCDADGIQLRVLSHYMDDPEFTEALVNGKKEDKTDIHSLNAIKLDLGGVDRARAKTFIYAWLLGAGIGKVAKILGCSFKEAQSAVERFIQGYPGLRRLKEEIIPADATRGYFVGFDGRIIHTDEYHMLAGYLQTGEACIMKKATIIWQEELRRGKIPFRLVNFVHDEWQTETVDDREVAVHVGTQQARAIEQAANSFSLRCPFSGTFRIGYNWHETH